MTAGTLKARTYEITSMILTWKSIHQGNLEIPKLPAYKAWSKDFAANYPYGRYAEIDLNADGVKELIVAESDFPASGRGFLILESSLATNCGNENSSHKSDSDGSFISR